jgi:PAS domain S-box-containing protein
MQLLGRMRATNTATRIIIYTGYASFASAKDAVNLDVSAYIEKGGDFTELIRALHRAHAEYLRVYAAELEERLNEQTTALQASKVRYRTLFENAVEAIYRSTPAGRFEAVNPALVKMLGYDSAEEVYALHIPTEVYVRSTDRERIRTRLGVPEIVNGVEVELKKKNGDVITVSLYSRALYDASGAVVAYEGSAVDITEKVRTEKALQEAERVARSTLDALSAHICVLDETGTILAVNKAWREYTAKNSQGPVRAAEGVNYLTVCDTTTGEFAEQAKTFAAGIRAVLNGEREHFSYEYYCSSPTHPSWFRSQVTKFSSEGPLRIVVVHEDITERKRAEEALRESEELFRTLAETTDVGILISSAGKTLYVNPALSRHSGYTHEEWLKIPPWELLAPEFHERREDIKRRELARQRGEMVDFIPHEELKIVTKRGATKWAHISRTAVTLQGKLAHINVIVDITERRRMEEEIRESEARFRATFEQAAVGMAHVDLEGRFFLVNQKLCDILEYSQAELLQNTCYDLTHPYDCAALKNATQQVIARELPSFTLEKRCLRKDGTVVWIRQTGTVVRGSDGAPLYFAYVLEDISLRKQIEAEEDRLIAILEYTPDFVVTTTVDGRCVYMNRAGRELLGVVSDADLSEWQGPKAYTQRSLEVMLRQALPTALRTGTWSGELVVVRPSGEELPVSQVIIAHKKEDGQVDYLSVIARDISEQKKVEEALQALSRRVLDAQEQERRHLARELHDELGQVLSAVKMTLQNGQRRPAHLAVRVEESVAMVQTALEQVRTLSRNLRPPMLDDLGLVAALRWYVKQQAQLMEMEIQFDADMPAHRFPLEVETVCFRIVQEALTNILRHAQAQHVWIELRYRDGNVQLLVRDDGVGFDVEAVCAETAYGKSSGLLGMRERAQLIGGHVQVVSLKGVGTEIRAVFPTAPDYTQPVTDE